MRNFGFTATLFVLLSIGGNASAQGYSREYNKSCECFEIKNHFDSGQLSAHSFETETGKKVGKEEIFYPNGQLQYQRSWTNNQLDGVGKHYFRDGKLYFEEYHDKGKKVGTWKYYDQAGELTATVSYKGNGSDGTYHFYQAGVKYLSFEIINGQKTNEQIHNQEIYQALKEEAEANKNGVK